MWISGTGMTSQLYKIKRGFKVDTKLAIKWTQGSAGNWVGTDRGSAEDRYRTKIRVHGYEWEVNKILTELQANRAANNNVISLSDFASNEKIFGADVDYSGTINATVVRFDKRNQKVWRGFDVELELQALSLSFSAAASLPTLQYVQHGYDAYNTFEIDKQDSYEGTFTYNDLEKDAGVWEGSLVFSTENMGKFRRYIATQRATTISIPDIAGVLYPFGPNRTYTYPLSVKVLEVSDEQMMDLDLWSVKVKFAEVVS